jgi:hypothetical protein
MVDSLLLQGVIFKASFDLEVLVKKVKKLDLCRSGKMGKAKSEYLC